MTLEEAKQKASDLRAKANKVAATPGILDTCKAVWDGWPYPGGCPLCSSEYAAKKAEDEVRRLERTASNGYLS